MIELNEEYDLCDIWRVSNSLGKSFIFQQNHFSRIINCSLDYIFISNKLQESSNKAIIFPKTDHSSVSVIIYNYNETKLVPGLCKSNNSLISGENFTERLKNFIGNLKEDLKTEKSFDDQVKWKYKKFEILKFMISYFKIGAKNNRKIKNDFENNILKTI